MPSASPRKSHSVALLGRTRGPRGPGLSWGEIADRHPPLTEEEERDALALAQAGCQEARSRMILHNTRWLLKRAGQKAQNPDDIDDLVSECVPHLHRAIDLFDPAYGIRFLAYAKPWVENGIRAWARSREPITLRQHLIDRRAAIKRLIQDSQARTGRTPEAEEIARTLGVPAVSVAPLLHHLRDAESLDRDISTSSDGTLTLLDTLESEDRPDTVALAACERERLLQCVAQLEPRRRRIVELLYGLRRDSPRTLEEVGTELELTKERVRQLKNSAITKLRRALTDAEASAHAPSKKS